MSGSVYTLHNVFISNALTYVTVGRVLCNMPYREQFAYYWTQVFASARVLPVRPWKKKVTSPD